jgi:hypothetical protein
LRFVTLVALFLARGGALMAQAMRRVQSRAAAALSLRGTGLA